MTRDRVLLVDDEEVIIEVCKQMLNCLGYRVLTANGGEEALTLYEDNREDIDLVVLDMVMPEMGGGVTFDRLKENDPRIKVILSSGYSLDGQAEEILERGCRAFIQKPFSMEELSNKLLTVLDDRQ